VVIRPKKLILSLCLAIVLVLLFSFAGILMQRARFKRIVAIVQSSQPGVRVSAMDLERYFNKHCKDGVECEYETQIENSVLSRIGLAEPAALATRLHTVDGVVVARWVAFQQGYFQVSISESAQQRPLLKPVEYIASKGRYLTIVLTPKASAIQRSSAFDLRTELFFSLSAAHSSEELLVNPSFLKQLD
jgi:hypothetical protein